VLEMSWRSKRTVLGDPFLVRFRTYCSGVCSDSSRQAPQSRLARNDAISPQHNQLVASRPPQQQQQQPPPSNVEHHHQQRQQMYNDDTAADKVLLIFGLLFLWQSSTPLVILNKLPNLRESTPRPRQRPHFWFRDQSAA